MSNCETSSCELRKIIAEIFFRTKQVFLLPHSLGLSIAFSMHINLAARWPMLFSVMIPYGERASLLYKLNSNLLAFLHKSFVQLSSVKTRHTPSVATVHVCK